MAEFKWFGHNCFRIKAREATIITDPVGRGTGYTLPKQTADIVTLSGEDPALTNVDAIKPDYQMVVGPGEYEMHEVFITGVRTHRDQAQGKERGHNTVYLIEVEGIIICHLGDLGHMLSEEQADALSNADVLLIPVGGGNVLNAAQAAEVVGQLEPKVVIPMHYATGAGDKGLNGVEPFSKELGSEAVEAQDKLVLRSSDLTETMRLVVLSPDGDGGRR
ncbi:MAG TPA: MBL fold metallo-hydrolase [Thermomicrobiales bacterium]|nr:MBL fold metallo-hydrolase [Thermomicrobiales bacterium]